MKSGKNNILSAKFRQAEKERRCMECGRIMEEDQRTLERGITYIWFKCPDDQCQGQLLKKIKR